MSKRARAHVERRPLRLCDVYAGCGSLALGFRRAGFSLVRAIEPNADLCATYAHNVGDWIRCEPPSAARYVRGEADVVCGAPPLLVTENSGSGCSSSSSEDSGELADTEDNDGGERRHKRPEGSACKHWLTFLRAVARIQPFVFVLFAPATLVEHAEHRALFDQIVEQASAYNYQVDATVCDAVHFGVAQTRRCGVLIGRRRTYEALLAYAAPVDDRHWIGAMAPRCAPTAAGDILRHLPAPGTAPNVGLCTARVVVARNPQWRKSAYAGKLFNGAGRPVDLSQPCNTLTQYMGGNGTPIVDQASVDDPLHCPWYERWHAAACAGTAIPPMPDTVRRLTVTEAAALTGFDATFVWCGSLTTQFHNVGNAVTPALVEAVAQYVADCINQVQ